MNRLNFPVFPEQAGRRIWREEVNDPPDWVPSEDEADHGPLTTLPNGIYLVTVSENTPAAWIDLAWRATIVSKDEHPGPDFCPAYNYDSAIAVYQGRVVGAALACRDARTLYPWTLGLKADGTAYTYDDLRGPQSSAVGLTFDASLGDRPAIFTIWVHRAYRRIGIGKQLVRALAGHFGLGVGEIGYRLPLSREAILMTRSMGLARVIGCF